MDITIADINNRTTSAVRAKVQVAPRREGAPSYPGAAWKTVKGTTGLFSDEAGVKAYELSQSHPENLYKVVTYNVK